VTVVRDATGLDDHELVPWTLIAWSWPATGASARPVFVTPGIAESP
jgi:hypothetical protein